MVIVGTYASSAGLSTGQATLRFVAVVLLGLDDAVAVVSGFEARLEAASASLDALNVFPVADNDTGSNMVRTVAPIADVLRRADDLAAAAERVESAALDGRGNSGLIIGQFLAGFFSVHGDDPGHLDLSRSVATGAEWARRAVADPVEGTMLTVADAAASALRELPGLPVDVLLSCVHGAVAATPTQLAVLAERGVVDSGAAGLQLFFEALAEMVENGATEHGATTPAASQPATSPLIIECTVGLDRDPLTEAAAYEVQFRVSSAVVDSDELRSLLTDLGTDVVIASSSEQLAAHVHVTDPYLATHAISAALETRPGASAISYDVAPIIESGGPA